MLFSDMSKIMVKKVAFVDFRWNDCPPGLAPASTFLAVVSHWLIFEEFYVTLQ